MRACSATACQSAEPFAVHLSFVSEMLGEAYRLGDFFEPGITYLFCVWLSVSALPAHQFVHLLNEQEIAC